MLDGGRLQHAAQQVARPQIEFFYRSIAKRNNFVTADILVADIPCLAK